MYQVTRTRRASSGVNPEPARVERDLFCPGIVSLWRFISLANKSRSVLHCKSTSPGLYRDDQAYKSARSSMQKASPNAERKMEKAGSADGPRKPKTDSGEARTRDLPRRTRLRNVKRTL